jgi:hypothetical protein
MIRAVVDLLFACRHRQITRPMTPVYKGSSKPGSTYVACLDCGQQFHYDLATMRMGKVIRPAQFHLPKEMKETGRQGEGH